MTVEREIAPKNTSPVPSPSLRRVKTAPKTRAFFGVDRKCAPLGWSIALGEVFSGTVSTLATAKTDRFLVFLGAFRTSPVFEKPVTR